MTQTSALCCLAWYHAHCNTYLFGSVLSLICVKRVFDDFFQKVCDLHVKEVICSMSIFHVKALHIISIVTWFSGLFYIVRLFIYFTEAEDKTETEKEILQGQFRIMQRRLWFGITWPSMIVALATGFWLLFYFGFWGMTWMQVKLGFVLGLAGYHLSCHWIFLLLQRGEIRYNSTQLRIWNEVATIFLVAIVFLVVLKSTVDFMWGLVGLFVFMVVLLIAIRTYRKLREGSPHSS